MRLGQDHESWRLLKALWPQQGKAEVDEKAHGNRKAETGIETHRGLLQRFGSQHGERADSKGGKAAKKIDKQDHICLQQERN
jgi:hypothetical protein